MQTSKIIDQLRLPVIVAPMFLVSGPELVIASSNAGLIGSFPGPNARTTEELEQWMQQINASTSNPWAFNAVWLAFKSNCVGLITKIVSSLQSAKSSIIICNSNDKDVQLLVNSINHFLENYGNTIDMSNPSYLRKGNDEDVVNIPNYIRKIILVEVVLLLVVPMLAVLMARGVGL